MSFVIRSAAILLLLAGFVGGADAQLVDCRGGQKPTQVAEMMFGRKIGDRIGVTEAKWARFVDAEITPRFPDGLTVMDGGGQWRGDENKLIREASKVVLIVLPKGRDAGGKIEAVRAAYKSRFHQDSVMLMTQASCVSF